MRWPVKLSPAVDLPSSDDVVRVHRQLSKLVKPGDPTITQICYLLGEEGFYKMGEFPAEPVEDWYEAVRERCDAFGEYDAIESILDERDLPYEGKTAVSQSSSLEAIKEINRHRAALGMPPLDVRTAGWTRQDVIDEAQRIARLPNPLEDLKHRLI